MYAKTTIVMVGLLTSSIVSHANPPAWISEGPYVEEENFSVELPIRRIGTKLFVEIEVGGAPRRFVFDTGSPSMMGASLASELGLKVIDVRQGTDAHGAVVKTNIVQTDFVLDGTRFHKVPVFVANFESSPTAQCLMEGVLGSEVLPLCAWQIDLPGSVLRGNPDVRALEVRGAKQQALYDIGFPHAPILDVRFHKHAKSKVMFDTGSPEYFAISPPDFEAIKDTGVIDRSLRGHGSIGESLGGRADTADHVMIRLKNLEIGNIKFRRVDAVSRRARPSLVGASILEHYIVTLSHQTRTAYFKRYKKGPFARTSFGFSPSFDDGVSIAFVWEGSPATAAGLQPGQKLTSINGEPADNSCAGIKRVLRTMSDADRMELTWDGGSTSLTKEHILD